MAAAVQSVAMLVERGLQRAAEVFHGKAVEPFDGHVQVAFLGMPDKFQNKIRLDGTEIAPPGKFTDNFNVRFKL